MTGTQIIGTAGAVLVGLGMFGWLFWVFAHDFGVVEALKAFGVMLVTIGVLVVFIMFAVGDLP